MSHGGHPVGCLDANKGLGQRDRAKPPVKEEQPLVRIHMKESCYVQVVGKSGRKAHYSDHSLTRFNLQKHFQVKRKKLRREIAEARCIAMIHRKKESIFIAQLKLNELALLFPILFFCIQYSHLIHFPLYQTIDMWWEHM